MIAVTENDLEKIKNDQEIKDGKKYHWDTFNPENNILFRVSW